MYLITYLYILMKSFYNKEVQVNFMFCFVLFCFLNTDSFATCEIYGVGSLLLLLGSFPTQGTQVSHIAGRFFTS